MPFITPEVADEHDALATYLIQQIEQLRIAALDLDDTSLRATPTDSPLSLAGLTAHVAQAVARWLEHVRDLVRPIIAAADLDARVPVPEAPWFPKELESWNVRWVCHHLIAEVARHAGHADLIRESLDGEIAYSLNARDVGETFDWADYQRA